MPLSKVAVSGASGIVGRHLLSRLDQRGVESICSSRSVNSHRPGWVVWDLSDWKSAEELDEMFPDVQAFLHIGAETPEGGQRYRSPDWFDANVRACLCLGEWAAERGIMLIYLSGAIVYSDSDGASLKDENAPLASGEQLGEYGFSKSLGEQVLINLRGKGLHVSILRATAIYGTGQSSDKLISSFLAKASRGEELELDPPTDDRINLVHADDVAQAIILVTDRGAEGIFNIGHGNMVSINEIAGACVQTVGRGKVVVSEKPDLREPISRFNVDISKAQTVLGYRPHVALLDGIARTYKSECF